MRAVWITRYGPPNVLELREGADPEPRDTEIRIRVAASGINFADLSARVGLYPDAPPPPCVVGYEVSGVVDAVGSSGAADFEVGDRVLAMTRFGGYADTVCVPLESARRIPESMSFEQGAALPVTYLTAHHMLFETGHIRPGSRVLVHMAAGGVGQAAIQLLKTVPDVEIFGTASASKHEFLREAGVTHPIDYHTVDYAEAVMELTDGRGVDLVLDALGGRDWKKGYDLLRSGGRLAAFGFANAVPGMRRKLFTVIREWFQIPRFNPLQMMDVNRTVSGVNLGHLWDDQDILSHQVDALLAHFEQGVIAPYVDKTFPFERAADAHQYIHDRKNKGKVLLTTGLDTD